MQAAARAVPSGMVSVIGLDEAHANELCLAAAEDEILTCANFNWLSGGQSVGYGLNRDWIIIWQVGAAGYFGGMPQAVPAAQMERSYVRTIQRRVWQFSHQIRAIRQPQGDNPRPN